MGHAGLIGWGKNKCAGADSPKQWGSGISSICQCRSHWLWDRTKSLRWAPLNLTNAGLGQLWWMLLGWPEEVARGTCEEVFLEEWQWSRRPVLPHCSPSQTFKSRIVPSCSEMPYVLKVQHLHKCTQPQKYSMMDAGLFAITNNTSSRNLTYNFTPQSFFTLTLLVRKYSMGQPFISAMIYSPTFVSCVKCPLSKMM